MQEPLLDKLTEGLEGVVGPEIMTNIAALVDELAEDELAAEEAQAVPDDANELTAAAPGGPALASSSSAASSSTQPALAAAAPTTPLLRFGLQVYRHDCTSGILATVYDPTPGAPATQLGVLHRLVVGLTVTLKMVCRRHKQCVCWARSRHTPLERVEEMLYEWLSKATVAGGDASAPLHYQQARSLKQST